MSRVTQEVTFEDVRLIFKNFSGNPTKVNKAGGKRQFNVVLSPEDGEAMMKDGWNVKIKAPRPEYPDDETLYFLPVEVGYRGRPPFIVLVSSSGRNELTEDTVGILDSLSASNVDLIIRPYNWEVNDASGVKAYLKTLYFTMEEDDLQRKYGLVDDQVPSRPVLEDNSPF